MNNLDLIGAKVDQVKIKCLGRYANIPINPWTNSTFNQMMTRGKIGEAGTIEEADILLFCDYLESHARSVNAAKIPIDKRILIILEPEVVLPSNFKKKIRLEFGTIINVGRPNKPDPLNLKWPQHWRELSQPHPDNNLEGAVMISGNKLSFVPGEFYSLRRTAAMEIPGVVLYGTDWDSIFRVRLRKLLVEASNAMRAGYLPKIRPLRYWFKGSRNWVGAPTNKTAVLENYRISLVIENSSEFLTEKLFDSFFAGCIPVYVGPSLENFGIPRSLVVTASADITSISNGIKTAEAMDYAAWYEQLEKWISDQQTKSEWSTESFFAQVGEIVISTASANR